jgi:hypothetical protein
MLERMGYRFDEAARTAFGQYLQARLTQPHFANARSVRNALDRARLRHASRLFGQIAQASRDALSTISAEDILASRVLQAAQNGVPEPC